MTNAPETPVSRIEVITSVQRRRHWSAAEKVRLVEEASHHGMSGREATHVAFLKTCGLMNAPTPIVTIGAQAIH